ncbi:hypothetical protein B4166_3318 [Caldibacillus thermoamylovorans]|nr:hypothetical protein B4166_3318 [Caldibacillus thermoamylovorans]
MNKIHKANQETNLLRKKGICEKIHIVCREFLYRLCRTGNIVGIDIDNVLYTEYVLEK